MAVAEQPVRSGRAYDALRPLSLERDVAPYAEGSCLVAFGDTDGLGDRLDVLDVAIGDRAFRQRLDGITLESKSGFGRASELHELDAR